MRLLDFVEQQHAMWMLVDAVGEGAALVEADITRRRADQPRNGMTLPVFRPVEAQELDAHDAGELLCHFRLADAGGTREEIAADGLLGLAESCARELDGRRQRMNG